jgi:hypothetical protein
MSLTKEQYLMICIIEEHAEVIQRLTKAIRFGMNEIQPGQEFDNKYRISYELAQLNASIDTLLEEIDHNAFYSTDYDKHFQEKKKKLKKYMQYSQQLGILEP